MAADLLAQLASLQPLLLARLFVGFVKDRHEDDSGADRLLTVSETASMLGMTNDYVYRHADEFPFTCKTLPKNNSASPEPVFSVTSASDRDANSLISLHFPYSCIYIYP